MVTSRLSDLYHADGASPDEQATLVLLWQANQGMFDALLLVGLLVMPVGVILLGLAMRRDPAFGKVAGNISMALGVVGLALVLLGFFAATFGAACRGCRVPRPASCR